MGEEFVRLSARIVNGLTIGMAHRVKSVLSVNTLVRNALGHQLKNAHNAKKDIHST